MGGDEEFVWLIVVSVGGFLSCVVAHLAGGGRASFAWGLLGPPGWIVAAIRGTHERLDDLRMALAPTRERTPAGQSRRQEPTRPAAPRNAGDVEDFPQD